MRQTLAFSAVLFLFSLIAWAQKAASDKSPTDQPSIPSGWVLIHEKHGCAVASPREWSRHSKHHLPIEGRLFQSKDGFAIGMVLVQALKRPWPEYDELSKRNMENSTIVSEAPDRTIFEIGSTAHTALTYSANQFLKQANMVCHVSVAIQRPEQVGQYSRVARAIVETVHSE